MSTTDLLARLEYLRLFNRSEPTYEDLFSRAIEAVIERDLLKAALISADRYVSHQDAACHQSCASWRGVDEDCHCGYVDLCEAIYNLQEQPT